MKGRDGGLQVVENETAACLFPLIRRIKEKWTEARVEGGRSSAQGDRGRVG